MDGQKKRPKLSWRDVAVYALAVPIFMVAFGALDHDRGWRESLEQALWIVSFMLIPQLFGWNAQQLPSPLPPLPASAGGANPQTPPIAYKIVAGLMVISIGMIATVFYFVAAAGKDG